jgi:polyisoprenyl-teichoic acid--peptidoglycan teichoic acid transferase
MTDAPPPNWSTRKPPPEGDGTEPPKRKRYWWRFSLASVIIVAVTAAATSSAILLYVSSIVHGFKPIPEARVAPAEPGQPQTILILGSDKRAGSGEEEGRADTTILLRLDAQRHLISVMSIPRDLKTEIPGHGTEKFNAAYSDGGSNLTVRVVEEMTGLQVNHIINVDFLGFDRAVDAIGCVYTDVDRRYFHSNAEVPEGSAEEYSEIDIKPGYQKLCGKKALEYVRYRHTDTDIVRSARQQSFLGQARHQINPAGLLTDEQGLVKTLTEYISSDIHESSELIELLDLLYDLRGAEVNQVHFPATLGPSYVYSNPTAIHGAVKEFLGEAGYDSKSHEAEEEEKEAKKAAKGKSAKGKAWKKAKAKKKAHSPSAGDGLVPAAEAGREMGEKVAHQVGGGFPVFYPTSLPEGAFYQEDDPYEHVVNPFVYHLKDTEETRHAAYRMVGIFGPEYEPNYLGVQGIAGWLNPPILDDPTETKTVNGREYALYTDSGQIKLVAWHRGGNTYWISNSLQGTLTNAQMMGIAESCRLLANPA